jgi:hypothetical protein
MENTHLTALMVADKLGKRRMMAAFDVQIRTLNLYLHDGQFPASWFDTLEKMWGRKLPRELFSFKGVPIPPRADDA